MLLRVPFSGCTPLSADGAWTGAYKLPNGQAQLWGVTPSPERRTFFNQFGDTRTVLGEGDLSPDGTLLALASSNGVRIWNVERGREVAFIPSGKTNSAIFIADGHEVLSCGRANGMQRWRLQAQPGLTTLNVGEPIAVPAPFAPERTSKGSEPAAVGVVGAGMTNAAVLKVPGDMFMEGQLVHDRADCIAASVDGKYLATSGWNSSLVKLWAGSTGKLVNEISAGVMTRVFFTPDSTELIVARESEFTFYGVPSMELTRRIPRGFGLHPGYIAFTRDGRMAAMEVSTGVIQLRDLGSGRVIANLEDPDKHAAGWMTFSHDGTQLIATSKFTGSIHRWDLRRIRVGLKSMGLDWDWPEFPVH
jgi:WD40 repeat protein